jgi:hypothetical protein
MLATDNVLHIEVARLKASPGINLATCEQNDHGIGFRSCLCAFILENKMLLYIAGMQSDDVDQQGLASA